MPSSSTELAVAKKKRRLSRKPASSSATIAVSRLRPPEGRAEVRPPEARAVPTPQQARPQVPKPKGKPSAPSAKMLATRVIATPAIVKSLAQKAATTSCSSWTAAMVYARKLLPDDPKARRWLCNQVDKLIRKELDASGWGVKCRNTSRRLSLVKEVVSRDKVEVLVQQAASSSPWSAAMEYAKKETPDDPLAARVLCKKVYNRIQREIERAAKNQNSTTRTTSSETSTRTWRRGLE